MKFRWPTPQEMKILASLECAPRYGLEIVGMTGLRRGSVYVQLGRLVELGYLEIRKIESSVRGMPRPYYGLTQRGTLTLARWMDISP